jgi:hypothetical protein
MRRGFEEAGAQLGVRTMVGQTAFHHACSGQELEQHIARSDQAEVRNQMMQVFGDFAQHHIAMIEGLNRGIRALLAHLDPMEYDIEKGPSFMRMLDKDAWNAYIDTFNSLLDNDQELHGMVFGPEFAEGYAEVAFSGRPGASPAPPPPQPAPRPAAGGWAGNANRGRPGTRANMPDSSGGRGRGPAPRPTSARRPDPPRSEEPEGYGGEPRGGYGSGSKPSRPGGTRRPGSGRAAWDQATRKRRG